MSAKIKVMMAIWGMGVGGAENVVRMLAAGIDRERFEPIVCCLTEGGYFADMLKGSGIPIHILGKGKGIDVSIIGKIRRLIRQEEIQLVHTHLWTADVWARVAAAMERRPVIVTAHNVELWKKLHHKVIDRLLAPLTYRFIAVSDEVKSFYQQVLGIDPDRLQTIYNGIDTSIAPSRSREETLRSLGLKGPTVGVVGRIVPQKDHRNFLQAARRVCDELPETNFLIIGDGHLREEATALTHELGLVRNVHFLGNRSDVYDLFHAMDVNVLSSIHEGHPISLLEAMWLGTASVVTSVGGNPELIQDDHNGLVVPPRDSQALAEGILRLLKDSGLRRRFSERSQKKIEAEYSSAIMARKYERIYLECLTRM